MRRNASTWKFYLAIVAWLLFVALLWKAILAGWLDFLIGTL